jgi:mono/diheme cytochrome c family protein
VDESVPARQVVGEIEAFVGAFREMDLETVFHPEPAFGNGYALLSLHSRHVPGGPLTDAHVHQLTVVQRADGSWPWNLPRPPIQSGAIGATALAVHGLKTYPIPGRQAEIDDRVRRARAWLRKARPESSEERAYQILGLAWAGDSASSLRKLAEGLLRDQRPDGGWGQLAKLPSDAYATGHSLYALLQGGGLSSERPEVRRGLEFLLRTQLADGTWHVRRRAFPFQPPMDSGFGHGADGWISASASSWAVMALASSLDPARGQAIAGSVARQEVAPVLATVARPSAASEGTVDFAKDIQPVLERSCVACHSGEHAKGGLQVVSRAAMLQGGKRGEPAMVAGKPEASLLLRCVTDQVEDLEMPPLGKRGRFPALTPDEIGRLSRWISQGATWPDGVVLKAPAP